MFRRPNILKGALTNRPYQSTITRSFAVASPQFTANPCFPSVDASIVKDDSFDFWAYREKDTQQRQNEFKREKEQLMQKYTQIDSSSSFRKYLDVILSVPTFRETVEFVFLFCFFLFIQIFIFLQSVVSYVLILIVTLLFTFKLYKKEKLYVVNLIMSVQFN